MTNININITILAMPQVEVIPVVMRLDNIQYHMIENTLILFFFNYFDCIFTKMGGDWSGNILYGFLGLKVRDFCIRE